MPRLVLVATTWRVASMQRRTVTPIGLPSPLRERGAGVRAGRFGSGGASASHPQPLSQKERGAERSTRLQSEAATRREPVQWRRRWRGSPRRTDRRTRGRGRRCRPARQHLPFAGELRGSQRCEQMAAWLSFFLERQWSRSSRRYRRRGTKPRECDKRQCESGVKTSRRVQIAAGIVILRQKHCCCRRRMYRNESNWLLNISIL